MSILQRQASDPRQSVWVSASAGTGKTKILVDRVLRLLLQGEKFSSILCLTYTKAAAKEMKERIVAALYSWSMLDKIEDVVQHIGNILGSEPDLKACQLAQKLYSQYIRADESLNIQTIHSFCQKLLQRFPIESGVTANFGIIDEIKMSFVLKDLRKKIMLDDQLSHINDYLVANFHEITLDELFYNIILQRRKILGTKEYSDLSPDDILARSIMLIEQLELGFAALYQDIAGHPIIENHIAVGLDPMQIKSTFLTQDGKMRARLPIKAKGSSLEDDMKRLQQKIYELDQQEKILGNKYYSELILMLAYRILSSYEHYKLRHNLLDYDDLIMKANYLLSDSSARDWILYKLDGFINHLLLDEAQDTSPEQWMVINALIQEFYSGESIVTENNRTIFVVGDEKQSIFSFQGADIACFKSMNVDVSQKMRLAQNLFADITLEISYRSSQCILDAVYDVFDMLTKHRNLGVDKEKSQQIDNNFSIVPLESFRKNATGYVEIWPLCELESDEYDLYWPIISEELKEKPSPWSVLAANIADYISKEIASGAILDATGRAITAGDFMILFRKRDQLTQEVILSLQHYGIDVSGLDRITLKENLSVCDLLSVAKFVLNMDDDLNLAALLKSPIIFLGEEELQKIVLAKQISFQESSQNLSLWQYLCTQKNYQEVSNLLSFIVMSYNRQNTGNFFHYLADILDFRSRLNAHNGPDSNDAIDYLIYTYSQYISGFDKSLQNFLFWIETSTSSLKRENNEANSVRIMTVHGSKGLQAPIVILCDTTSLPTNDCDMLWDDNGCFFANNGADNASNQHSELKARSGFNSYNEYLRLLYVGMTRAEDRLIICGYQGKKSISAKSWYEIIKRALMPKSILNDKGNMIYRTEQSENQDPVPVQAHKNIANQLSSAEENTYPDKMIMHKPSVIYGNIISHANNVYEVTMPAKSSKYTADDGKDKTQDKLQYGIIFHKIMEDTVKSCNLSNMRHHPLLACLKQNDIDRMQRSIEKIESNIELQNLSSKSFKTELSIGYINSNGDAAMGRIDLIIFEPHVITIIDYKSDRETCAKADQVPEHYRKQLAQYKEIISRLYSNIEIVTKILWLENGTILSV